jgi:hypothetical protein
MVGRSYGCGQSIVANGAIVSVRQPPLHPLHATGGSWVRAQARTGHVPHEAQRSIMVK